MTTIQGLGGPAPAKAGQRVRQGTRFQLAEPTNDAETAATAATAATGRTDLGSLLAAQETGPETVRDRAARRQGGLMLDLLRALQHAALSDRADPGDATLTRLADLAAAVPMADDPRLGSIQQAIRVRAAVELARRERPA